jgi:SAM-dependent methyltransferase
MTSHLPGDFPEHAADNRHVWDANARWWDDRIGDGNEFQTWLIEPATERLLAAAPGDTILDIACGAGRMARRIAANGARVVAFDASAAFIARARERTPVDAGIEYHVADAASPDALLALGANRFDKAVCTMALMDMPEIEPLFATLPRLLIPGGTFVFSVLHPCFLSAPNVRVAEIEDDQTGRGVVRSGSRSRTGASTGRSPCCSGSASRPASPSTASRSRDCRTHAPGPVSAGATCRTSRRSWPSG